MKIIKKEIEEGMVRVSLYLANPNNSDQNKNDIIRMIRNKDWKGACNLVSMLNQGINVIHINHIDVYRH